MLRTQGGCAGGGCLGRRRGGCGHHPLCTVHRVCPWAPS